MLLDPKIDMTTKPAPTYSDPSDFARESTLTELRLLYRDNQAALYTAMRVLSEIVLQAPNGENCQQLVDLSTM